MKIERKLSQGNVQAVAIFIDSHLHFQEWTESQPFARIVALERHWRVWELKLRNRRKYWIRFISIPCKNSYTFLDY